MIGVAMALTEPGMLCALCRMPIADPNIDTFCTTAHAELYYHPTFNALNDAAVHQSCMDSWSERDAFMGFYNSEVENRLIIDRDGHTRYRRRWHHQQSCFVATLRIAMIAIIAIGIIACLIYCFGPRPIAAQISPDQSIDVNEAVRQYRLVVPHSLPDERIPIVFAFHGIGDSPEGMTAYSALDRLAADNGFILVYPKARRAMWTTVNVDADNLDDNPDIRFYDRLLEDLAGRFPIDPNRVYLIGMSNGAKFAQLLAFARPNVTAAVAHSGPMPRDLQPAANRFPVLLLVGTNDSAADAMRSDAAEYRQNGHLVEFVAISGLGHEWSASHNDEIWRFLSRFDQR